MVLQRRQAKDGDGGVVDRLSNYSKGMSGLWDLLGTF